MLDEVVVGILVNSLALLSDAAHMLTDAAALALALVALRLARRPPRGGFTYGLKRAEILSAQANGITLLLLAAVARLRGGPPADRARRRCRAGRAGDRAGRASRSTWSRPGACAGPTGAA